MNFGEALAALKNGDRVTRAAWAEGGAFLYLVPGSTFQVNRPPLLGIYPEGTEISYRPHIDIRMADGTCSPWQPSQDALMAEDWSKLLDDDDRETLSAARREIIMRGVRPRSELIGELRDPRTPREIMESQVYPPRPEDVA